MPALRAWRVPVAIAAVVVVVDQLTKHWAVNALVDRNIDVFWTLRLNLSYNTGMAFSQGEGLGPIIGVVALAVVVVLVLNLKQGANRLTSTAVGLVIGGALGNVIDRVFRAPGFFRGAVVDFIDFQWFPIFNVADTAITIGGALLVLGAWLRGRAPVEGETRDPVIGEQ